MNKLIVLGIGIPAMAVWLTRHTLHKATLWKVPKPTHIDGPGFVLTIIQCDHCGKTFRLRSETSQK